MLFAGNVGSCARHLQKWRCRAFFVTKMKNLKPYLDEIFYWLGALLIAGFAWFVYPPLPLLVLGIACLIFAYLFALAARQAAKQQESKQMEPRK